MALTDEVKYTVKGDYIVLISLTIMTLRYKNMK